MTLAERLALPDVSGLNDQDAAAVINAPAAANGTVFQDFDPLDLFEVIWNAGEWGKLEQWSRPAPTGTVGTPSAQDNVVQAAVAVVRVVMIGRTIRASRAAVRTTLSTMFGALVTAGVIAAATRTALIALASRNATWGEVNGYPYGVTARDVGLARGGK